MISTIQILVLLLAVAAAVAVLAARLKIPPAILLVLTGGCGARTATGSLKAVFESSDVERFTWVLMEV